MKGHDEKKTYPELEKAAREAEEYVARKLVQDMVEADSYERSSGEKLDRAIKKISEIAALGIATGVLYDAIKWLIFDFIFNSGHRAGFESAHEVFQKISQADKAFTKRGLFLSILKYGFAPKKIATSSRQISQLMESPIRRMPLSYRIRYELRARWFLLKLVFGKGILSASNGTKN